MARIRSIKPSFWGDDAIACLSLESRLLVIGLISMADDRGRFLASPNAILGYVFPHDDIPASKLRRWLAEAEKKAVVELYRIDGREYGWLPNFTRHQRISHPQPSAIPPPPSVEGDDG